MQIKVADYRLEIGRHLQYRSDDLNSRSLAIDSSPARSDTLTANKPLRMYLLHRQYFASQQHINAFRLRLQGSDNPGRSLFRSDCVGTQHSERVAVVATDDCFYLVISHGRNIMSVL